MLRSLILFSTFELIALLLGVNTCNAEDRGLRVEVKDAGGQQIGLYEESHALLIGVDDYTAGWPDLPGVKRDLRAIQQGP